MVTRHFLSRPSTIQWFLKSGHRSKRRSKAHHQLLLSPPHHLLALKNTLYYHLFRLNQAFLPRRKILNQILPPSCKMNNILGQFLRATKMIYSYRMLCLYLSLAMYFAVAALSIEFLRLPVSRKCTRILNSSPPKEMSPEQKITTMQPSYCYANQRQ